MPSLTIGEVPNGTQPVSYDNGRVVVYEIEYPWAVMLSTAVADDAMSNNGPVNAAGLARTSALTTARRGCCSRTAGPRFS